MLHLGSIPLKRLIRSVITPSSIDKEQKIGFAVE